MLDFHTHFNVVYFHTHVNVVFSHMVKCCIIFRSNQWSTTGLSKAVVCTVLSMEKCI